jgi:hypothetical protein
MTPHEDLSYISILENVSTLTQQTMETIVTIPTAENRLDVMAEVERLLDQHDAYAQRCDDLGQDAMAAIIRQSMGQTRGVLAHIMSVLSTGDA